MAYKKPQIVAKSAPKQSFVADCPPVKTNTTTCGSVNRNCPVQTIK